jgi:hypothetical protein
MEKSQFHTNFFTVLVLYKGSDILVLDQFFLKIGSISVYVLVSDIGQRKTRDIFITVQNR